MFGSKGHREGERENAQYKAEFAHIQGLEEDSALLVMQLALRMLKPTLVL